MYNILGYVVGASGLRCSNKERKMKIPKFKKPISLRLTPSMAEQVEKLAESNGLAVVSQIRMLLAKGLLDGKRTPIKKLKGK